MSGTTERTDRVLGYVRPVFDFYPKPADHTLYLEQALVIYPWLEELFRLYPRVDWVKSLWRCILTGGPFKHELARLLGAPERFVGRFHRLPPSWIWSLHARDHNGEGIPVRDALSVAAWSLPFIEKDLFPATLADCQLLLDAWGLGVPLHSAPLRGFVAASLYTQVRVANNITLLTKLDEWLQIALVNQQLAKLIPDSNTRLNATRRIRACASLAEFVLAFLLCERPLGYVLQFSDDLGKRVGKLQTQGNVVLPYLDVEYARATGRRCPGRGLYVTPIRTTQDMRMQAAEMNNCMGTLVLNAALAGFSPYMAIRDKQGRLVAHLELGYAHDQYTQQALLGRSNGKPPSGCQELVDEFLDSLNSMGLTPAERVSKNFDPAAIPGIFSMSDFIRQASHYWRLQ